MVFTTLLVVGITVAGLERPETDPAISASATESEATTVTDGRPNGDDGIGAETGVDSGADDGAPSSTVGGSRRLVDGDEPASLFGPGGLGVRGLGADELGLEGLEWGRFRFDGTGWVDEGGAPDQLAMVAQSPLASPALFVDGSRPDGPHVGTIDAPFHRPIDALNVVEPGTTIYLRGGVYDLETHGSNILRRRGTPEAWIHIRPYPGESVEIISGGEWGNGFEFQGSAYATIAGFRFTGRDDSIHGSGVFGKDGAHDIVVSNNYIEGFGGAGVSFVRSSRITVEGNEVRNNAGRSFFQGSGISLFEAEGPLQTNGGYTNVIRANHVVGNYNGVPSRQGRLTDGNCIIIDYFNETNFQGATLVENNVCVENGGRGVHVFYSSNVVARNNTLIRNGWSPDLFGGRAEMVAARGTNISFYNNLVINRDGVAAFLDSRAQGVYINNLVASGPPEGPGNGLLPAGEAQLETTAPDAPPGAIRPRPDSPVVGAARPDLQAPIDALGRLRPGRGSVGALEPTRVAVGR